MRLAAESVFLTIIYRHLYLPEYVDRESAAASQKQYKNIWQNHLKARVGRRTLRDFKAVHAQRIFRRIVDEANLGRSSLRHARAFLSGCFNQARQLGFYDEASPIQGTQVPRLTCAYSMTQIKTMLARLPEPARTVVLIAAWTGLRKSELWGLRWSDFSYDSTGKAQITVRRSIWNGIAGEPKTEHSAAPVAVEDTLRDALKKHRLRMGKLAEPDSPIFQAGHGQPLNLDNLARRVIAPSIEKCAKCQKPETAHKPEGHLFELDKSIRWAGWHAFRQLAANLYYEAHADDKTIQRVMRHGTLKETRDTYIQRAPEAPSVRALESLAEKFSTETEGFPELPAAENADHATQYAINAPERVQWEQLTMKTNGIAGAEGRD